MKRQLSICIFLSILLIVLVLFFIKSQNEDNDNKIKQEQTNTSSETNDNTQSITIGNDYKIYYFYAINEGGNVFIYDIKSETLYMETGIETESLPENIKHDLQTGIYFENEEQLFSFLESYSS